MLEEKLKSLALKEGAIRAGIARREAFAEAPPSADMTYVQPWAQSVVSFALPLGTEWIRDYFAKVTRMEIKKVLYHSYHKIYQIGAVLEDHLKKAGYRAYNIVPNGQYRPDHTFSKTVPDPDLKPPLSLRYMAVGAGVGEFGWSGNVMVPGAWSDVYLGAVITDAPLSSDALLNEKLCDRCRACVRVCPMGFMDMKEKVSVKIAGREHIYNKKRGDYRCFICCAGYTGISKEGTWSSWSTGRKVLPEDDSLLLGFYVRLRSDPANAMATKNTTSGTRGVLARTLEDANPTCANCGTVCSGPRDHRLALMELLFSSGSVEKDARGGEIVIKAKK
jgi:ferredoxin